MEKFIAIVFILFVCSVLWCLPLYLVANFLCWVFHLSFHLSLLQSFAICLLVSIIKKYLFYDKEEDI